MAFVLDNILVQVASGVLALLLLLLRRSDASVDPLAYTYNWSHYLVYYWVYFCLAYFVLYLAYFVLPTARSGQTLGKRLMGVKVVNAKGRAPGYGTAAMREVLGKILSALLFLGYLVAVFHREKRALHDLIGGTWVVWDSSPAPVPSETPESPR